MSNNLGVIMQRDYMIAEIIEIRNINLTIKSK